MNSEITSVNRFFESISPLTILPENLQFIKCNTNYHILVIIISIYSSILCWKTNENESLLMRIVYTILAFIFGFFYIFYHLFRYGINK